MNLRNINLRFLLYLHYCEFSSCFALLWVFELFCIIVSFRVVLHYCEFSSCFCDKWLMTQFVLFFFFFFCDTQLLDVLERTSFIKAPLKQYLPCLPERLFIQQLFPLFLRTLILFWWSKVHCLTLILPAEYLILSGLWS